MLGRITTRDLILFTRQFATMIEAGLPITKCLDVLIEQIKNDKLRSILRKIMEDVETGSTLYEALLKHKNVFGTLYLSMIKAGEAGGFLGDALNRIAIHLEKADSLKRKIRGAMAYPLVIFVVAIGVLTFMLVAIIPTFAKMFESLGSELPFMTQAVINLSSLVRHYLPLGVLILVGVFVALHYYRKTDAGRTVIDNLLLKLPLFGSLIRKTAISRFARTLSTLITSGIPILQGLEITARTSGNKVIEDAVLSARKSISSGKSIAEPLKNCGVFPPMVTQLIAVGEESGNLAQMLERSANFYEEEVDATVSTLTSIIEPITIVFMGGLVGVMLISMYMPMFEIASTIK